MKAILSTISLSIFALFSQSYSITAETNEKNGIQFFEGSFQDALELAKKENKLIFFDAYASWCGPCKRMKSKVFTQEEVGSYFNSRFINLKVDMEKGEGPSLAKKYGVTSYPTLLFIDHTGKLIHGGVGYHNPSSLIGLVKGANQ